MTDAQTRPASDRVAIDSLWGGVRVVVLDVETTIQPGGGSQRAVSIGAVTCRGGTVRGKWQTLINPQMPVHPDSRRIHGITDDHLVGEPTFAEVVSGVMSLLHEADGERLIVVCHNVGFDIGVLRYEAQLLGLDLPAVALLDTMGALASLVGVRPATKSLEALAAELGVINPRPHDALADAVACAEVVVELLQRAAQQGHTDIDTLLATVGSGTTLDITSGASLRGRQERFAKPLPEAHVAGHATALSKRAGRRMLAAWREQVAECAELRCRHLAPKILAAEAAPTAMLTELEGVLEDCCTRDDTAGAATVLGALLPLLVHLPPTKGRLGFRTATIAWAKTWSPKLRTLGRCADNDLCPACLIYEPCPLDAWPDTIAQLALGDPNRYARGFFETTGRERGTGVYTQWAKKLSDHRVPDSGVWMSVEHWRRIGQVARAEQLAQYAWEAGCRHPDVADAYAGQLAAAGKEADLLAALDVCDIALSTSDASTHDGWSRLRSRRSQLDGRLQRLVVRPSGKFDENGNPIPIRRHHPEAPHRVRTPRFARSLPAAPAAPETSATPPTTAGQSKQTGRSQQSRRLPKTSPDQTPDQR